jgi:hypothetical protein
VFTPAPEEGKPQYEKETGKPWVINNPDDALKHGFPKNFRRTGWWGRHETLHPPIFKLTQDRLNQEVARMFHNFKNDASTYVVVMTGRQANMDARVKEILNHYGIHADEYFFRAQKSLAQDPKYPRQGNTFDYKIFTIMEKLMTPYMEIVEIFDDREEHIPQFVEFGKNLKKKFPNLKFVIVHDVRHNKNYNI